MCLVGESFIVGISTIRCNNIATTMKTSKISLSLLVALAPVFLTASPLPSTCRCVRPSLSSWIEHPSFLQRTSFISSCEDLWRRISEGLTQESDGDEATLEDEDINALPAPIDSTERPLPTTVLMQLSSNLENKLSAPCEQLYQHST